MKIDRAWHFLGAKWLPPEFSGPGPFELSLAQLEALTKREAVLIYHEHDGVVIAFDSHRGRFKQR